MPDRNDRRARYAAAAPPPFHGPRQGANTAHNSPARRQSNVSSTVTLIPQPSSPRATGKIRTPRVIRCLSTLATVPAGLGSPTSPRRNHASRARALPSYPPARSRPRRRRWPVCRPSAGRARGEPSQPGRDTGEPRGRGRALHLNSFCLVNRLVGRACPHAGFDSFRFVCAPLKGRTKRNETLRARLVLCAPNETPNDMNSNSFCAHKTIPKTKRHGRSSGVLGALARRW